MNRLVGMGSLSYLLTGFTHVILGAVLTEMLQHYARSYSDGGMLIFLEFAGFLCGVLCMPYFIRSFSRRASICGAFTLLALSEIWIALLPPWSMVNGLALIAGFSFGVIESGIGTFVMVASKEKQAIAMSKLEVAFGIGALVMPFISSFLITRGVWSYSFLILGGSALIMAVIWSRISMRDSSMDDLLAHKMTTQQRGILRPAYTKASLPILCSFMFFFFLYVGMETSIINFLPSIFIEKMHSSTSIATLTVSAFWLTMVIGRVFAGIIAEKYSYFSFLAFTCGGSVILLMLLALNTTIWGGYAIVLLLGLLMAGMFAVALIFANRFIPGMTERTTSLLIASGGLGGSLLPLGAGWSMDRFASDVTLWIFVLLILISFAIILYSKRWEQQTA
jgi:FHS family glucose/mannose:H+ symporter-like MFS transporter